MRTVKNKKQAKQLLDLGSINGTALEQTNLTSRQSRQGKKQLRSEIPESIADTLDGDESEILSISNTYGANGDDK